MSESREPVALIDLDNTLCDYAGAMDRDMKKIMSPDEAIVGWHGDDVPAYITERKKLIQDQPGWWQNLDCIGLGMSIAAELGALGYRRMILTKGPGKRNAGAWTEKVLWCREHVPGVPVTVTADKSLVYGTLLVDDFPEYIEAWLNNRPRGVVLMPAQPWNADYKHERVLRVTFDNLLEAVDLARRAAERVRGQ